MADRGWGRVINMSSMSGEIGNYGQANYAAAKAGMIGLTKTLAREYARKGVTVNAVAPGFTRTRMTEGIPDKALEVVMAATPLGRMGEPVEIAAGVVYLASPIGRLHHGTRARYQRGIRDVDRAPAPLGGAGTIPDRGGRSALPGPSICLDSPPGFLTRRHRGDMTGKASNMANDISDITLGLQQEWFNQALAQQKAVYETTLKMWSRFFAVPRVIDRARDVKVGTTPSEIVYEEDTLRLLRYRRETPAVYAEPVLVCYALVNRPYIVDLQTDRSVIRQLLARGFEVYLIDWGVPSAADRSMTLKDYVDGLIKNCVDDVAQAAQGPEPFTWSATAWAARCRPSSPPATRTSSRR